MQIDNTYVCASMLIKKVATTHSITTHIVEHCAAERFMALETLDLTRVCGVQRH